MRNLAARPRRGRSAPRARADAITIAIWVYAVVEAIGILYVLWTV